MAPKKVGGKMQREVDRNEQLARLQGRYCGRGKVGKGRLLDGFCEQYGYERKYAIKLLGGGLESGGGGEGGPGPERKEPVSESQSRVEGGA
jgi:hypothetical protein